MKQKRENYEGCKEKGPGLLNGVASEGSKSNEPKLSAHGWV